MNKKERFDQLVTMVEGKLISMQYFWSEIEKLGYIIEDGTAMMDQILQEQTMIGGVAADAQGARLQSELDKQTDPTAGA